MHQIFYHYQIQSQQKFSDFRPKCIKLSYSKSLHKYSIVAIETPIIFYCDICSIIYRSYFCYYICKNFRRNIILIKYCNQLYIKGISNIPNSHSLIITITSCRRIRTYYICSSVVEEAYTFVFQFVENPDVIEYHKEFSNAIYHQILF